MFKNPLKQQNIVLAIVRHIDFALINERKVH